MRVRGLTNTHSEACAQLHGPCTQNTEKSSARLSVALGDALDLVLLLDGVAVGRALGSVHDLVGKALSNGLDVPERRLARARRQQVDRLVHPAQRRHIARLAAHGTATTRTCTGFWSVSRWMISNACLTIRTAITFLPLLRPYRIMEHTRRSTIGQPALRKRFFCQRP